MALAAIIALIHDLIITAGIYALSGLQVSPSTVIALLTILGLLALRHRRGLRQGAREHRRHRRRQPDDLQPGGEPRGEPDPGPVDQHLDHRAAAGRSACWSSALGCSVPARCEDLSLRAVHRSRLRCLLLDLHRDAARCVTSRSASRRTSSWRSGSPARRSQGEHRPAARGAVRRDRAVPPIVGGGRGRDSRTGSTGRRTRTTRHRTDAADAGRSTGPRPARPARPASAGPRTTRNRRRGRPSGRGASRASAGEPARPRRAAARRGPRDPGLSRAGRELQGHHAAAGRPHRLRRGDR